MIEVGFITILNRKLSIEVASDSTIDRLTEVKLILRLKILLYIYLSVFSDYDYVGITLETYF